MLYVYYCSKFNWIMVFLIQLKRPPHFYFYYNVYAFFLVCICKLHVTKMSLNWPWGCTNFCAVLKESNPRSDPDALLNLYIILLFIYWYLICLLSSVAHTFLFCGCTNFCTSAYIIVIFIRICESQRESAYLSYSCCSAIFRIGALIGVWSYHWVKLIWIKTGVKTGSESESEVGVELHSEHSLWCLQITSMTSVCHSEYAHLLQVEVRSGNCMPS